MAKETYEKFEEFNKKFCADLPKEEVAKDEITRSHNEIKKMGEDMKTHLDKHTKIKFDPSQKKLMGSYTFEKKTGRDFLYTLIHIVNDRKNYQSGNYFFFRFVSDETNDVMLVANPTDDQPGNGIIITSASSMISENQRPNSWNFLFDRDSEGVEKYFQKFMEQTPFVGKKSKFSRFFEISVLLVFEVARRLVSDQGRTYPQEEEDYDSLPVASCIAMCVLMGNLKDCLGVLKGEPDERKSKANEILKSFYSKKTRDEKVKMMKELFNPRFQEEKEDDVEELDKKFGTVKIREDSNKKSK